RQPDDRRLQQERAGPLRARADDRQSRPRLHAARLRRDAVRRRPVRRVRSPRRPRVHLASRLELRPLRSRDPARAYSQMAVKTSRLIAAPADITATAAPIAAPSIHPIADRDPLWYKDAII